MLLIKINKTLIKIIKMKKIFHILIILTTYLTILTNMSFGQCNVTKDDTDPDNITFSNQAERLFINEDLENGFKTVYANGHLIVNKIDKTKVKFIFNVSYIKSMYQPNIVLRKITFNFANGQILSYIAEQNDNPKINGTIAERCFFRINLTDMKTIQSYPISSFAIIDTRKGESLTTKPYSGIFQEQIQCLVSKQNDL